MQNVIISLKKSSHKKLVKWSKYEKTISLSFEKKELQKKFNNFWFELFQIEISMDSEPQENSETEQSLTLSYFNQL